MGEEDKINNNADGESDDQQEVTEKQNDQTQQIIETGAVTPTGGRFVIHCLTVVGQTVTLDNEYLYVYITASESPF